jgi:hypothetical protein
MSLNILKKEIERELLITKWYPTEDNLKEIAKQLKEFQGKPTKHNIEKLILGIVGSYESVCLEGVDNSDLTTLLLLATKTVSIND